MNLYCVVICKFSVKISAKENVDILIVHAAAIYQLICRMRSLKSLCETLIKFDCT